MSARPLRLTPIDSEAVELEIRSIQGKEAVAGGELVTIAEWRSAPDRVKDLGLESIRFDLSLSGEGHIASSREVCPVVREDHDRFSARVFVTNPQLRSLDEARGQNGCLKLGVSAYAQFRNDQGLRPTTDGVQLRLNASEWNDVLSNIGYLETTEFRLPLGGDAVPDSLVDAFACYRRAVESHRRGECEPSLVQCRRVLEALPASPFDEPFEKSAWKERGNPRDWSWDERIKFVEDVLRHATHQGAHETDGPEPTREDTEFVLICFGGLLRLALRREQT